MNTMRLPGLRSRKCLLQSLALSLALHAAAVTCFYFHPMILRSPFKSPFSMTTAQPTAIEDGEDLEAEEKNRQLDEVFQQLIVLSPHFQHPYDMILLPRGISLSPIQEESAQSLDVIRELSLPLQESIFTAETTVPEQEEGEAPLVFASTSLGIPAPAPLQIDALPFLPEFSPVDLPDVEEGTWEDLLCIERFPMTADHEHPGVLGSLPMDYDLRIRTDNKSALGRPSTKEWNSTEELGQPVLSLPNETLSSMKKEIPVTDPLANPDSYEFPAVVRAKEWNDDFDVDVTFLPNPKGQGYIFSLALKSNCDMASHSLKQNLYFILDRSGSIQKHRFAVFRRAVVKSLSSMQRSDTFNILVVDKKIVTLSPENLTASPKNIQAAEEFLDKQEGGGLFDSSDIYTMLEKLLPFIPDNEEVHTALLLTDGQTGMSAERKQAVLKKWLGKNNGRLALYPCAIGSDNDLLTLDMLASVSGGKLLYSDTHASFPRKLSKLVLDLKDPVAKDLLITALPHNPHSHIEFHTLSAHQAPLYSRQPWTVYGQIDDPCSFDLILQGRHAEDWIAIKKTVSFIDGRKGDGTLEKQWNGQYANTCYSRFLEEGKKSFLKQALEILKKSRSDVAFE